MKTRRGQARTGLHSTILRKSNFKNLKHETNSFYIYYMHNSYG